MLLLVGVHLLGLLCLSSVSTHPLFVCAAFLVPAVCPFPQHSYVLDRLHSLATHEVCITNDTLGCQWISKVP